jgi:hypothetical protein
MSSILLVQNLSDRHRKVLAVKEHSLTDRLCDRDSLGPEANALSYLRTNNEKIYSRWLRHLSKHLWMS